MDEHLDALGYLLAAVVFSVGFLSGRIHTSFDSTVRAVSERSWRVRQAISEGGRLGPADLADLLGVVHRSTDYVAVGSRLLNWTLFASTCAVLADALGLRASGVKAPDHEMLVLGLLFAASLAVVIFSEFDVRRVSIERRREVAASTLGRLQNLAHLMAHADIPQASRELARLRETFATWGLLVELEAYVDLLRGQPHTGLKRIESLVSSGGDLYVSPVVGVACCLELERPDSALALLARIARRGESVSHLDRLHQALAVSAGHLPALLASQDSVVPADSPWGRNPPHSVVQGLIGQEIERRREPIHDLALDLDPAKVAQTAPLIVTLDLWEHGGEPSDFASDGTLSRLLQFVLEPEKQRSATAALKSYATGCHDPITLESFGLLAFACGEPRTALGFFESAIRLAPAAARSHWGRAIACQKVGWFDAATASLRRVATLSDNVPLVSVTRRLFQDRPARVDLADIGSFYPEGLDDMDRFELSLLGIDVG
ncbi:MAG: hypothetical protein ABSG95_15485, partial [Solirubrobacteraceae bacterium]